MIVEEQSLAGRGTGLRFRGIGGSLGLNTGRARPDGGGSQHITAFHTKSSARLRTLVSSVYTEASVPRHEPDYPLAQAAAGAGARAYLFRPGRRAGERRTGPKLAPDSSGRCPPVTE
jgi:hypothetical protein